MTTKAQLRKAALGLPGTEVVNVAGLPVYQVHGKPFASLTTDAQVLLHLDAEAVRNSLTRCTITEVHSPVDATTSVAVPLSDVNGMELNNLVYRSWLNRAPAELAASALEAIKGEVAEGPDALPRAIGKPATRALLLAGISTLTTVAGHSEAELLALHGVGPRAIRILRDALQASGRNLAPEAGHHG